MIYSFYFSPTGGTKKVMDILTEGFMEAAKASGSENVPELKSIDFTIRSIYWSIPAIKEEDICFVGVPSYGGRVPAPALERIEDMKGRGALVIPVVVYGNRAFDDTLLELKTRLYGRRFYPVAAVAAVAEHSIMHKYGAGRPDAADAEELKSFGAQIWKRLGEVAEARANGKHISYIAEELVVPGNETYVEYEGVPLHPTAGKICTGCGVCVGECPAGAIPVEDPKETNEKACNSCMRCTKICPVGARSVSSLKVMAASMKMKKELQDRKNNYLF